MSWTAISHEGLIYATARDVTEEKEAAETLRLTEEALRQSQKMEAVGQLTGGIAHDFNNLLQGIVGSLDLAQKRLADGRLSEIQRYHQRRHDVGQPRRRAHASPAGLLAPPAARSQAAATSIPLIASMEDLLRRTLGERIQLEFALSGDLWPTLCDQNQLENSILNLAINARDAMPDGGKLRIETSNRRLDTPATATTAPGEYVCIDVIDTGTGMTPDVMARAFDPFFTTKPMGQGTGLGLSMIYGFARQSDGYVKIGSEVGRGTTVSLFLPRHDQVQDVPANAEQAVPADHEARGQTVLVVEDEPLVRLLIIDVLQELGYRALEASDGPTGLRILESPQRIDLLITDIGLPGLNGRQVADAARVTRPDLKVLFMTGYAENAVAAKGFLAPGMQIITKPFVMDVFGRRIRELMEAPTSPVPWSEGSQSVISGMSVMAISEPRRGMSQGRIAMVARSIERFATRASTNSTMPSGGWSRPIIRLSVMTTPKWIGSMPTLSSTGISTGTRMLIEAMGSRKQPTTSRIRLMISRMT